MTGAGSFEQKCPIAAATKTEKPISRGLHQSHALKLRVANAIRDLFLIWVKPHCARERCQACRQDNASLDPLRKRHFLRRRQGLQRPV